MQLEAQPCALTVAGKAVIVTARESHHFSLATIRLTRFVLEETFTRIVNRLSPSTKPRKSILAREVIGLSSERRCRDRIQAPLVRGGFG